jgi:transposase
VFKTWLGERDTSWRDCVEVVAMDGFTGFKTATSEELPDAVAVIDPRRGRGDLGHPPAHDRRLPRTRQEAWQGHDAGRDRLRRQRRSATLTEIRKLGRTLKQGATDILAFFDRPGTSNGPTEAINGRLEHLRGSALGFRNLTNYIARSLLEAGGFRPRLPPRLR